MLHLLSPPTIVSDLKSSPDYLIDCPHEGNQVFWGSMRCSSVPFPTLTSNCSSAPFNSYVCHTFREELLLVGEMVKVVTPLLLLLFLKVCLAESPDYSPNIGSPPVEDFVDPDAMQGLPHTTLSHADVPTAFTTQLEDENDDEHEKIEEIKDTEETKDKNEDTGENEENEGTKKEENESEEEEGEEEGGHGEAHEKAAEEEKEVEEQLKEAKKIEEVEKSSEERERGSNGAWNGAWNVPMTNLHPTGLRLGQHSSSWANLFWEAPPLPDHIIVANYSVLCFQPEYEHFLQSVSTPGPETEIRLSGLEMGTMYQCDVRVKSLLLQLDLVAFLHFYI